MSRIKSEVVTYKCDGHGYMQSDACTGHALELSACLSSDTVSILIDGVTELVLSDAGYEALEKAVSSLRVRWAR